MQVTALEKVLQTHEQVLTSLAYNKPIESSLALVCDAANSMLQHSDARISIHSLAGNKLTLRAGLGFDDGKPTQLDEVDLKKNVLPASVAAKSGQRVIVEDIDKSALWAQVGGFELGIEVAAIWAFPILSSAGNVLGVMSFFRDQVGAPDADSEEITQRMLFIARMAFEHNRHLVNERQLEKDLGRSKDTLATVISVMPDMAIIADEDGKLIDFIGQEIKELGIDTQRAQGAYISDLFSEAKTKAALTVVKQALSTMQPQQVQFALSIEGSVKHFEGRVSALSEFNSSLTNKRCVVWLIRDITQSLEYERRNTELAYFDPLTGLPNRLSLLEKLEALFTQAQRHHQYGSVLFLDLNDFKRINDSLGHSVGDELLKDIARRLKNILRDADFIARIGGDEFVLVLENLKETPESFMATTRTVAQKIIKAFGEPFPLRRNQYFLDVSIGIYMVDDRKVSAFEALTFADTAMYRAKAKKRSAFEFFDPSLQKALERDIQLENDLYASIKQDEFVTYFQPQINVHRKVVGLEALVRWLHPSKGLVPPNDFIPLAEKCGVLGEIQRVVVQQSCDMLLQLQTESLIDDDFRISINVNDSEFQKETFIPELMDTLIRKKVSPSHMTIELTEGAVISSVENAIEKMRVLQAEGFFISIDDFGTGYSSLNYLHTFPFNELKIDKSFIDKLQETPTALAILDAFISLSSNLGLHCIAEGVETRFEYDLLARREVHAIQGYFFSPPLPPGPELLEWFKK